MTERIWKEKDGVIYFTVTSDGTTGEQWITRLEAKGYRLSDYAKQILRSPEFKPTNGVIYNIAVLKGMLFNDSDRDTKTIRNEATSRKLSTPNAEISCLIRELISDKDLEEMGLLWIVTMHEPIEDSDGDPSLLDARRVVGGHWLNTAYGRPDVRWRRNSGFAFVALQV